MLNSSPIPGRELGFPFMPLATDQATIFVYLIDHVRSKRSIDNNDWIVINDQCFTLKYKERREIDFLISEGGSCKNGSSAKGN